MSVASLFVLAVCAVTPAVAAEPVARIEHAWVRAAAAGQAATPLFADVVSEAPVKLTAARSSVAKSAALMVTEIATTGEATIKDAAAFDVAPGTTFRLAPRGPFIQLRAIARNLRPGDAVPFSLEFTGTDGRKQRVDAEAVVRGVSPRPDDYDAIVPAAPAAK
jgi:copper(I)-binding protein